MINKFGTCNGVRVTPAMLNQSQANIKIAFQGLKKVDVLPADASLVLSKSNMGVLSVDPNTSQVSANPVFTVCMNATQVKAAMAHEAGHMHYPPSYMATYVGGGMELALCFYAARRLAKSLPRIRLRSSKVIVKSNTEAKPPAEPLRREGEEQASSSLDVRQSLLDKILQCAPFAIMAIFPGTIGFYGVYLAHEQLSKRLGIGDEENEHKTKNRHPKLTNLFVAAGLIMCQETFGVYFAQQRTKNEYVADAYSAKVMGSPKPLIDFFDTFRTYKPGVNDFQIKRGSADYYLLNGAIIGGWAIQLSQYGYWGMGHTHPTDKDRVKALQDRTYAANVDDRPNALVGAKRISQDSLAAH